MRRASLPAARGPRAGRRLLEAPAPRGRPRLVARPPCLPPYSVARSDGFKAYWLQMFKRTTIATESSTPLNRSHRRIGSRRASLPPRS